jgi:hypothetical protein
MVTQICKIYEKTYSKKWPILMKVCFNKLFPIKQNKNEDLLLEKFNYISSHADIEKL